MSRSNWRTIFRRDATENKQTRQILAKAGEVWGSDPIKLKDMMTSQRFANHKAQTSGDRPVACVNHSTLVLVHIVPGTKRISGLRLKEAVILRKDQYRFLSHDTALLCRHYQPFLIDDLRRRWGNLSNDHLNEIKTKLQDIGLAII